MECPEWMSFQIESRLVITWVESDLYLIGIRQYVIPLERTKVMQNLRVKMVTVAQPINTLEKNTGLYNLNK